MSWDDYRRSAEKGPLPFFWRILFPTILIFVVIFTVGYSLGWFGEAAQVAKEEFGPRAGIQKYEWFIDQANRIEKMDQDIKLFENRLQGVNEQYKSYGEDKTKWPPHIQAQYNRESQQSREDLLAVVSQRNNLVRDYNAASEKFNWSPFQTNPQKPKERYHEYVAK